MRRGFRGEKRDRSARYNLYQQIARVKAISDGLI